MGKGQPAKNVYHSWRRSAILAQKIKDTFGFGDGSGQSHEGVYKPEHDFHAKKNLCRIPSQTCAAPNGALIFS
jgi:hypothetical protein